MNEGYRAFFDLNRLGSHLRKSQTPAHMRQSANALRRWRRLTGPRQHSFPTSAMSSALLLPSCWDPLEDALAEQTSPLPPTQRARLETAHRNSLRLMKLVNTLLDFSRIEAGRLQATYELIDLSAFTAELASVFRSAIERGWPHVDGRLPTPSGTVVCR